MFSKTKIALAAALIFGSASAALAADSGENHWESVSGTVARGNAGSLGTSADAASAYGYAAPMQKNRPDNHHACRASQCQ